MQLLPPFAVQLARIAASGDDAWVRVSPAGEPRPDRGFQLRLFEGQIVAHHRAGTSPERTLSDALDRQQSAIADQLKDVHPDVPAQRITPPLDVFRLLRSCLRRRTPSELGLAFASLRWATLSLRRNREPPWARFSAAERWLAQALSTPQSLDQLHSAWHGEPLALLRGLAIVAAAGCLSARFRWSVRLAGTPAEAARFLGTTGHPGDAEVRQVYLGLIKRFHPDRHPHADDGYRGWLQGRLAELNHAYDLLMSGPPDAHRQQPL